MWLGCSSGTRSGNDLVIALVACVLVHRFPVHDELAVGARRADGSGNVETNELNHPVLEPWIHDGLVPVG
jgi:hypothetical protein